MKSVPRHFPDWISQVTVPKKGGTLTQVVASDVRCDAALHSSGRTS